MSGPLGRAGSSLMLLTSATWETLEAQTLCGRPGSWRSAQGRGWREALSTNGHSPGFRQPPVCRPF